MAKKNKPHIKKFKKDTSFETAFGVGQVLQVIEDLKEQYPQQSSKVQVTDVQVTKTYGHDDKKIVVKYIYVDKPNKGVQKIELDNFSLQEIIDRYLN